MKTIRSNPWGFGIHSPFVYRLVTNGLSGKMKISDIRQTVCKMNRREKRRLSLVLNLIDFLQPEFISIPNDNDVIGQYLKEWFQNDLFPRALNSAVTSSVMFRQMIIGMDLQQPTPEIFENDIWLLTGLNHGENRKLLERMLNHPRVSVSLETRHMAILIFNPLFQKQHYIVRSWFYLCR
jgi:hypothetical protein